MEGATASITSQENSNIGGIGVNQSFADAVSSANARAAAAAGEVGVHQAFAAQWQAIGNAGMSYFGMTSGKKVTDATKTQDSTSTNIFG
jgi:hypothetical protein